LPALQDIELAYIQLVLKRLGGNKRQAAAALGIGRRTLYRRLGIDE
jgi:transcriptional regulator with PAS, ATPase and Fis domain